MQKPIPARNLSNADRKAILELWQKSGQSLSAWRQENDTVKLRDDVIQLPHLSTLYDWASRLGFSTQPTEPDEPDDTHRPPSEPIPEELPDESDEPDESPAIHDDKEGEEDLLAKERIDQLEPSTAPDPHPNVPDAPDASSGKKVDTAKVVFLVGGVALAGVTVLLLIKWAKGRRSKKQEQAAEPRQTERMVNPFGADLQTLP